MNTLYQIYTLADTGAGGGGTMMIIMIGVLLLVMYFFMIRPQRKQERETNAMRNGLQVGDEITTIGGIIGKIVSIKGETCMIETGKDRTKIRILKSAVKCVDVPASVANGAVPVDPSAKKEEVPAEDAEQKEIEAPAEEKKAKKKAKKNKE